MTAPYGQQQADEALAYEHRAADQVTAQPQAQVNAALAAITAAYILAAGTTIATLPAGAVSGFRATVVRALSRLRWEVAPALRRQALTGWTLGVTQAQRITGPVRVPTDLSPELLAAIRDVDINAAQDLREAVLAAQVLPVDSYPRVVTVTAKASGAVRRVEATTRWVANKAVNEGSAAVAEAHGVSRILVTEVGACLTCLAYAGHVVGPGELFPAGLTFGDYSTVKEPFTAPPLHPHCRCHAEPYLGHSPSFGVSLPNTLQREALRQVALGRSQYASEPARVRAADRLLHTPTSLPDIVKIRARRAVQAGRFPRRQP
ncbi:MAG TPA: hypothetical protein VHA75_08715 [Rugosimonospora sp.]|nr:hypothetical protein [Rugosimonospora sp.]